jgi:hypothetical protein
MFRCSDVQMFRCSDVQMFRCSDVRFERGLVKQSVRPIIATNDDGSRLICVSYPCATLNGFSVIRFRVRFRLVSMVRS